MSNVIKFDTKRSVERQVAQQTIYAKMSELPPECELAAKMALLHDKLSASQWNKDRGRND